MSRKLLGDFAALGGGGGGGGGLQSLIMCHKNKENEREKEGKKGTKKLNRRVGAVY